jgi:phosphoserine phosphatase RsbU/P
MRDKAYLVLFLLGAGLLLYVGRGLLAQSTYASLGLSFAGTTAAGILGIALYRVQLELRASRHELARKEAELSFAREVQLALFPREFPSDHSLQFMAVCVPARGISGDYYDVMEPSSGRLVFAFADISGKGISAAILMSNVHAVLRTLAAEGRPPAEVCSRLNRHLYKVTDASRFATVFYGEWNDAEKRLTYTNAGHNAPILLGSRHGDELDRGGPPLGLFLESRFEEGSVTLQPGDLIAVYSDGITDAENSDGEPFGEFRLEGVIATHAEKSLAEIQQQVLRAVHEWSSQEASDDATLLLARVTDSGKET